LPLGYCTNVHPGQTVAEVLAGLDRYTVPVMQRVGTPVAAGLWLARPVVDELLAQPEAVARFGAALADRKLICYTLNAFPYGNFHAARVKENVYLPDWSQPERLTYTEECAAILAELLPAGIDGSISTLPLGFKGFETPNDFEAKCIRHLIACAAWFSKVEADTGRVVRLAIEPEPFCRLETTAEAVAFFERLWRTAGRDEALVRRHIGLCYDVCHQAVEYEDIGESIRTLDRAGVRINKVQISCAIQLDDPAGNASGRAALKHFVEPRYLHQTFSRSARAADLTESLIDAPPEGFRDADSWRVHFHVPVDAERFGPLATTRPAVVEAIAALAALDYAPHREVETYTWNVLPGSQQIDLIEGLSQELEATRRLIGSAAASAAS
jgi:sugar phosphate isomerase/epimerase